MKKYGVSNSGSKNLVQPIHIWIVQEGLENKKLKLLQASLARGNLFEVSTVWILWEVISLRMNLWSVAHFFYPN